MPSHPVGSMLLAPRLVGLDPLVQEMHAVVASHSGYEPVRLKFGRMKKLRAVIGAVICWKSHANTRSGHEAAQDKLVPIANAGHTSKDDVGFQ
jgi:hypothetical protein